LTLKRFITISTSADSLFPGFLDSLLFGQHSSQTQEATGLRQEAQNWRAVHLV